MLYITGIEKTIIDTLNLILITIFFYYLYQRKYLNRNLFIFFFLYTAFALCVNNIFIDPFSIFDQIGYLKRANEFRESPIQFIENFVFLDTSNQKFYTSILYSFLPLPNISTINSIALGNKLILLSSIIFFINKNRLSINNAILILIIPSTLFYSSVGLKEILILVISMFSIYFFSTKNLVLFFFSLILLYFTRPIFFYFVSVYFIIKYFYNEKLKKISFNGYRFKIFLVLFFSIVLIFIPDVFWSYIQDKINLYIKIFTQENLGWGSYFDYDSKIQFSFNDENLKIFIYNILSKLFLLDINNNLRQLFFILETIVIFFLIFKFNDEAGKLKNNNIVPLLFIIITFFIIFGLVVNYYTTHRYFYNCLMFYFFSLCFNEKTISFNKK